MMKRLPWKLLGSLAVLTALPLGAHAQSDWTPCANEGDSCRFSGEALVRFGAEGKYAFRMSRGGVACNVEEFGDPLPNRPKQCQVSLNWRQDSRYHGWRDAGRAATAAWRYCAAEGAECWVEGQARVRFGANGRYETRNVSGRVDCTVQRFGDPLPGTPKTCEVEESANWTLCANEGDQCRLPARGRIRYGANGRYVYKDAGLGGLRCVNEVFGDPVPEVAKQCDYVLGSGGGGTTDPRPPAPVQGLPWTVCANEKGQCSFRGVAMLRYGSNGRYAYREAADGLACTNESFGFDPAPNETKRCEVLKTSR